jgi:phosphoglycolate phosphatase-like HAD superfamily hydrolase
VKRVLLVLDFDGVICDSIDECFVSSWIAWHRLKGLALPPSLDVALRGRFADLRPFIRSGEDYVVIQDLLAAQGARRHASTQAEFDAALAARGPEGMQRLKDVFYQARGDLLASDRPYWLALNRVYPHLERPLAAVASRPDTVVLSTKKSEFIVEILAANGVDIPLERVLYTGARAKVDIITAMLEEGDRALLIDDQIDHLLACRDPRIDVRLALWGYIKPEWLEQHPDMPRVSAETLQDVLSPWLTRPRRAGA